MPLKRDIQERVSEDTDPDFWGKRHGAVIALLDAGRQLVREGTLPLEDFERFRKLAVRDNLIPSLSTDQYAAARKDGSLDKALEDAAVSDEDESAGWQAGRRIAAAALGLMLADGRLDAKEARTMLAAVTQIEDGGDDADVVYEAWSNAMHPEDHVKLVGVEAAPSYAPGEGAPITPEEIADFEARDRRASRGVADTPARRRRHPAGDVIRGSAE